MDKVTVVVLAYNEANNIANLIECLSDQRDSLSVFKLTLLIVPNGCTDATANIARDTCTRFFGQSPAASPDCVFAWSVSEIPEKVGKAGAWNEAVHRLAPAYTECFVFVDADVTFFTGTELADGVRALVDHPEAFVSAGNPTRTTVQKMTWVSRIGALASDFDWDPEKLCGQHYTLRADIARRVFLPLGLTTDDGFIKALATTNFFRGHDPKYFVRISAKVGFQPEHTMMGLYRHELSMTIGNVINAFLFEEFHVEVVPDRPDAGSILAERYFQNPSWLRSKVAAEVVLRGSHVVPAGVRFRRLQRLKALPTSGKLKRFPFAFAGFCFDQIVCYHATRSIRNGKWFGLWKGGMTVDSQE